MTVSQYSTFDVFDTLVTRKCGGPDSLLYFTGSASIHESCLARSLFDFTPNNLGVNLGDLTESGVFKFKHFLRNDTYLMLREKHSKAAKFIAAAKRIKWALHLIRGKVSLRSRRELYKYMVWGLVFNPKVDFPGDESDS